MWARALPVFVNSGREGVWCHPAIVTFYPPSPETILFVTHDPDGGHYVPLLAWRIVEGNKAGNAHINLQGGWWRFPLSSAVAGRVRRSR